MSPDPSSGVPMGTHPPTVFVVDDDQGVRESLSWLISSIALEVETFDSARAFLTAFTPERGGCLLVDVRMPGMSGLELHRRLKAENPACLPVIIITGHGDVQMAVRAMKEGAFDFIEKPFNDQVMLDLVQKAVDECVRRKIEVQERQKILERLALLTPREHEVVDMIVAGDTNKVIAYRLSISDKTVETHRARVMEKLQAASLADLVRKIASLDGYREIP